MPDKGAFFRELVRVLAPGGRLVLATWCRRPPPLSPREERRLERIYTTWALPFFVPLSDYVELARITGLADVRSDDWSRFVAPTWEHQLALGARDLAWLVRQGPRVVGRSLRDAWAVRDMIRGYATGTVVYGVLTARRPAAPPDGARDP